MFASPKSFLFVRIFRNLFALSLAVFSTTQAFAADKLLAQGHVPELVKHLTPIQNLSATKQLTVAVGLPLQNQSELNRFLAELYDPASPNYHRYLTPEEFTRRFGPTESDYESVAAFASRNGLVVTARYSNRMIIDLAGSAGDIGRAFHTTLRIYRDPDTSRDFFAPDVEPSVEAEVPILDVSGLSDFRPPQPRIKRPSATDSPAIISPKTGSAADGTFMGNDFRAAYAPGVTLTGVGQSIGLVQFDGFYSNDIVAYENEAGLPNVPIQTVLIDGYNGVPTSGADSGNGEVSLDIELAISMAPGLSKIIVYEAGRSGIPNRVLNCMATNNAAKQLSCSWGWGGGPSATTDQIFQQMAAQGQSFFCASGDSDAFTAGANSMNGVDNAELANAPADSPYITIVGGTTLTTTGPGGSRVSETVWNWGGGKGSSGGVSSYYSIPSWQQGIDMSGNGGSASFRNLPDVACAADNIYVLFGNGKSNMFGGSSCAAPLWAGFLALVNQQAENYGLAPMGFVNPALYAIGKGANFSTSFYDVTAGNNTWSSSPNLFYAQTGFDLCTGWGTPSGAGLINALAALPDPLRVIPGAGFTSVGPVGGSFSVSAMTLILTNTGSSDLDWTLGNSQPWLTVSKTNGNLPPGISDSVTVSLNSVASNLLVGAYTSTLWFTNLNTLAAVGRAFSLQVTEPLIVSPAGDFNVSGLTGGPFNTNAETFMLTNSGGAPLSWSVINPSTWLTVSPESGTLGPAEFAFVTASLNTVASNLADGDYSATISFTNWLTGSLQTRLFSLHTSSSIVQNGGFETGNFSGWNRSGNAVSTSVTAGGLYVHSGVEGLQAGPSQTLGYLSQALPTVAGQSYLLSFWLDNPKAGIPNEFQVTWDGNVVLDQTNLPALGWTNIHLVVVAATNTSLLQFGFRNDPTYFGFDDVSVSPFNPPVLRLLNQTNAAIQFEWNTVTGLVYQTQYKTDLQQTGWIDLGAPFIATNSITGFSDSTVIDRQRFYRITVVQ
jgi:subtilase family serine protease